jgi:dipeptidyl-peptidase 4
MQCRILIRRSLPLNRAAARLLFAVVAFHSAGFSAAAQSAEKKLTIDALFAHEPLIGQPPSQLTWSPDGKHLTYIDGGELIDLDPGTGKPHVLVSREKMASLEGTGGSEQDRDHRSRYKMASYLWAPDSTHLMFDSNGRIWLYDLRNGAGVLLGSSGAAAGDDPKFSPDGQSISFIKDHGLAVIHFHNTVAPAIQVAPAPNPSNGQVVLNGEVDWVYEEELDVRSNYFWSPDSSHLAFLQSNETNVPQYPIADWIPTHATVDQQRFPQPGDPNPDVRVEVVGANGGRPVAVHLALQRGQEYVPRFGWLDAKTLWIETLTRDHKHRAVYFAEAATGQSQKALEIDDDKFIDENYDLWAGSGFIVLTQWSDGHNHLYLYSYDQKNPGSAQANLQRQLTSGDYEVSTVYRVDFNDKTIDYASNEGNPLEQQLGQVGFDGTHKQLTTGAGFHEGNFAPAGSALPAGAAFVDRYSTRMSPPTLRLCQTADKCNVFWQTHALDSYHLHAPEQLEVKASDGATLYATLLLPAGAMPAASVPVILNPYGGPGIQTVQNRWGESVETDLLFDELLAQHGFAVLRADNRGMAGRGRAFAQAAYHNFGPVQLKDQLTILDAALGKYPRLDPKRLGWWGWSWGGTFTLYAMTHSDRFRAGVAVAPVTDWKNYDSIYTERYMGIPSENVGPYKDFSVVNDAANLKGRILLVHGTGDDNVHFENTVQVVQALIEAGKPYDLQIFPRKTHSIAGAEDRTQLFTRILAHFEQYLMPPTDAAQDTQ